MVQTSTARHRRKKASRPQKEEAAGSRLAVWLSKGPDWHLESDMKEEELQKDMAKNEAKSRPLSLRRARACSEKQRVASRPKKEEAAGMQSAAE